MRDNNLQNKIINATKWSAITEIGAKLVSPVTNMILARLIVPEDFGVVATVTMIISFADMFSDSGFQKYLIQHEFRDDDEKYKYTNVAFWTNLSISIALWGIIALFSEQIAILVGNPGLGKVISISCIQLPLTSFSSIQMALYRRDFDFKTLFIARMFSICIPFIVTVPLALIGLNYWAMIIGTLVIQFSNAIILTIKSKWKPSFSYNINILKEMFSFSVWSLIEAISIWLTTWIDTFIIANSLSQYYLGLYKTSTAMVNTLLALIIGATTPVLFSTLSRLQEDRDKFNNIFLKFQRLNSILLLPLGIGTYLYRDIATQVLLGNQWIEASGVVGIWAITRSIKIVFCDPSSEVYRSMGKPKLSFLAQLLHLIVLIPTCIITSKNGFWSLVYARSLIQMQFVLVHFIILKVAYGISIIKTINNILPIAISAVTMGVFGYLLQQVTVSLIWSIISIVLCVAFYFGILFLFSNIRKEVFGLIKRMIPRRLIQRSKVKPNEV